MNRPEPSGIPTPKCLRFVIMLGSAILLPACGGGDLSDLEDYVKEVQAREKSGIEPLPEFRTAESFVLNTSDLRNPFVPAEGAEAPEQIPVQTGMKPDIARPREELESYSLDSLRMVGTVTLIANLWGLIKANDGTIHRVQSGNYMGQNHGKIVRILEDQIELMEIIPDGPGSWREQQAVVKLSQ
ncbi:MAG: pilus assembly protein PilP [Methylococcales bacterium]